MNSPSSLRQYHAAYTQSKMLAYWFWAFMANAKYVTSLLWQPAARATYWFCIRTRYQLHILDGQYAGELLHFRWYHRLEILFVAAVATPKINGRGQRNHSTTRPQSHPTTQPPNHPVAILFDFYDNKQINELTHAHTHTPTHTHIRTHSNTHAHTQLDANPRGVENVFECFHMVFLFILYTPWKLPRVSLYKKQ